MESQACLTDGTCRLTFKMPSMEEIESDLALDQTAWKSLLKRDHLSTSVTRSAPTSRRSRLRSKAVLVLSLVGVALAMAGAAYDMVGQSEQATAGASVNLAGTPVESGRYFIWTARGPIFIAILTEAKPKSIGPANRSMVQEGGGR